MNDKVLTKENVEEVYAEAKTAAINAANESFDRIGERDCCGFAWVNIRPARGLLVSFLKKAEIGDTSCSGGYDIWNPSDIGTQSMTPKEQGARAFAKVFQDYGVNIHMGSRMD